MAYVVMTIPSFIRAKITFILKTIIGVGLLVIICRTVDFKQLLNILRDAEVEVLCFVWLTYILDRVIMAVKWNLLLKDAGIHLSSWDVIRIYFIGNLLGMFTPGELGGDAYRIFVLSKQNKNATVAVTIILERIIGLAALMIFVLVLLPFSARVTGAYSGSNLRAIGYVILSIGCFLLSLPIISRCLRWVLEAEPLQRYKIILKLKALFNLKEIMGSIRRQTIVLFSLLTVFEIITLIYMNYLSCRSLQIPISFFYLVLLLPGLYLILRLPVTIQGLGIQEGLWVFVMRQSGFSSADGIAVSVILRLMQVVSVYVPASLMMMAGKGTMIGPLDHKNTDRQQSPD